MYPSVLALHVALSTVTQKRIQVPRWFSFILHPSSFILFFKESAMSTIGVAVLGTGWVAGEHIKSYRKIPDCRVVGLCSRTPEGAKAKSQESGLEDARIYATYEELLADPAVQAISICTPPHLHPRQTIQAAQAGKHVLLEKAAANDP